MQVLRQEKDHFTMKKGRKRVVLCESSKYLEYNFYESIQMNRN
jgi:hypothetical protein